MKFSGREFGGGEPVIRWQCFLFGFIVNRGTGDVDGDVNGATLRMGGVELNQRRKFAEAAMECIARLRAGKGEGGLLCIDHPWGGNRSTGA